MSDKQNTEKYFGWRRLTGLKLARAQVLVTTGSLTAQWSSGFKMRSELCAFVLCEPPMQPPVFRHLGPRTGPAAYANELTSHFNHATGSTYVIYRPSYRCEQPILKQRSNAEPSLNNTMQNIWKLWELIRDRGSTVVKALCYKSEGRWFDFRWCQWNFSLT